MPVISEIRLGRLLRYRLLAASIAPCDCIHNSFPTTMPLETSSRSIQNLSHETLSALLSHIESQLYRTPIYRQALALFQSGLGESADSSLGLLEAVARQAIALSIAQLTPELADRTEFADAIAEAPDPDTHRLEGRLGVNRSYARDFELKQPSTHPGDRPSTTASRAVSESRRSLNSSQHPKKPTKQQQEIQAAQKWRDRLTQIGQELQRTRQQRRLSLFDLQEITLIPHRHIEAIEAGNLERLPEEVYLRSFIQKIGDSLGLDGGAIAASLPACPKVTTPLPSWSHQQPSPLGFSPTPFHLYLGYTALMASAIAGLTWHEQQSLSEPLTEPDPTLSAPDAKSVQSASPSHTPGLTQTPVGFCASSDIAPPEALCETTPAES